MKRVAILIPTYGRVDRLEGVVANATHPDASVYLIMEPDEAVGVKGATTVTRQAGFGTYAAAINHAYKHTDEPLLFAGADDINFHAGWLEAAVAQIDDNAPGVVGTNDLMNPDVLAGNHATHFLVDRRYLDQLGGVFDEGPGSFLATHYDHNFPDREFIETAALRGRWQPCLESVVEHMHHAWGKAQIDSTYHKSMRNEQADQLLFNERMHNFKTELAKEVAA